MKTFILFWNPAISSYTMERMQNDMEHLTHVSNWSVWQHEDAHIGDRFFMVRCGEGKTGICMSGKFESGPYKGEDWSGKGREVYYVDLLADTVIDPDYLPILTTEELTKQIPGFDWSGGHSGRVLPTDEAEKLEKLWAEFIEQNKRIFRKLTLFNGLDDFPKERVYSVEELYGFNDGGKRLGIRYYEYGMKFLKQYQYDRANAYFRVAYDTLQENKSLECYPDVCYRIACGMPANATTEERINIMEEALEGFKRLASMGKRVSIKKIRSLEDGLELLRREQMELNCEDVVSPNAASKVQGLELIDDFLGYDYTKKCKFHDAEIMDLKWSQDEVVMRINIYDECIATFRFIDMVNFESSMELPHLYSMKFRMCNSVVECDLDGVGATITCEEVVCEKVEKYEENKE